jgi:3',5'-cyclic AMP phosphodiesterase CpdA
MGRVVILSDIHLSPTHGFFWENWCLARDFANRAAADAVIVNGDLTINGPDSDEEVKFAALAIKSLHAPVLPLPGNHDVGDEPPGQDPDQIVNIKRLARWDSSFGADRWMMDTAGWRLIGVNAQLFGSSLTREDEQNRWLEEQLIAATGRPIALFLHKPLFLQDLNEGPASAACIVPLARASLVDTLHTKGV